MDVASDGLSPRQPGCASTRPHRFTLRARWGDALLGLLAITIILASVWFDADRDGLRVPGTGEPLPTLCVMHNVTGLDCPLCGMSRSFVALADGDLSTSVARHPAGPFLALGVLVMLIALVVRTLRGGEPLHRSQGFTSVAMWLCWFSLAAGITRTIVNLCV